MRAAVIQFPGSNCDRDMAVAIRDVTGADTAVIWHRDTVLPSNLDLIAVPGGFSYGDYLRSGAMAARSPIMQAVVEAAGHGVPVLGVCNGFQILCEAGLLPGVLLQNDHQKFVCKNVYIKSDNKQNLIGPKVGEKALKIPVAHGEGRYYADAATLKQLHDNKQIVFRYCDEHGEVHINSNPNGAINNIAGICNEGRNVYGMMPHPERACSPALGNIDGKAILMALS